MKNEHQPPNLFMAFIDEYNNISRVCTAFYGLKLGNSDLLRFFLRACWFLIKYCLIIRIKMLTKMKGTIRLV